MLILISVLTLNFISRVRTKQQGGCCMQGRFPDSLVDGADRVRHPVQSPVKTATRLRHLKLLQQKQTSMTSEGRQQQTEPGADDVVPKLCHKEYCKHRQEKANIHTHTHTLKILPSVLEYGGIQKTQEQPSMHCKHINAPCLLESGE